MSHLNGPVDKLLMKNPLLFTGPGALVAQGAKALGTLAIQHVAPKLLAIGAVSGALSLMNKGGEDSNKDTGSSSGPGKERVVPTKNDQLTFAKEQKTAGKWADCKAGGWRGSFESIDGKHRFTPTIEKWEFEVYKKSGGDWTHCGIMRATGQEKGEILERFAKWTTRK
jgi:hypothetical protein